MLPPRQKNGNPFAKREFPTVTAEKCLAKTIQRDGTSQHGCSVPVHLKATYQISKILWSYFQNFRSGTLFTQEDFLAPLLHDIGKISPAFLEKIYRACGETQFSLEEVSLEKENHCITSALALEKMGLPNLAWVAAAHHGRLCSLNQSIGSEWLGGESWEEIRETLVQSLCETYSLTLQDISDVDWKKQLVLGLTILSDWLSSGLELGDGQEPTEEMLENAVRLAGFVPFAFRKNLTFGDIFQTAEGLPFSPNPVQLEMVENIRPGAVYVLEMEMGGGKTEAALYLAYRLLSEYGHNGVYFALPTQLTSDKIYERVVPFLDRILAPENANRHVLLAHGKAWLRKNLEHADASYGTAVDDWFDTRKRKLLAPFAVGTVDQLLMSVINVRHSALRALGAMGKVVILDEVHSYDVYTGSLIQRLVRFLRNWGCTVILLSATLTKKTRQELLGDTSGAEVPDSYPLLSVSDGKTVSYPPLSLVTEEKNVALRHSKSLEESLQRAQQHAENGECVLWIENTVGMAQEVYRRLTLQNIPGVSLGLIHSRFPERVRQQNETLWTGLYGKDASFEKRAGGKILIGTQVLEQSVDIDADYLITRLCPVDMLLQRLGRLWRHRRWDALRPKSAKCEAEILNEAPFINKTEWSRYEPTPPVYAPYVLARSQEVLERRTRISIPEDIRELIEQSYAEREETDYYAFLKQEMEKESDKLSRYANMSTGNVMRTQNDTEASTRYAEEETVDVLLFDEYDPAERLVWLHGLPMGFRLPEKDAEKSRRIQCTIALSENLIRVRKSKAPRYEDFPTAFLSPFLYTGHDAERPLRAAFVGQGGTLLGTSQQPIRSEDGKCVLRYDQLVGYQYEKKGSIE